MKSNVKKSVILFLLSYIIVTILAYGSSFAAAMLFKLPSHIDPGVSIFEDPAFVMTVPYHLLINLIVWILFSYLYLKKMDKQYFWKEMYILSITWLIAAMFVDLVFFVLIKTPYSLTAHQFYIEYQPWISITYFIVFLSPFIAAALVGPKVFR